MLLSQQINFNPGEAHADCVTNTAASVRWQPDQQQWKSGGDKLAHPLIQSKSAFFFFNVPFIHIYIPMAFTFC